MWLSILAFLRPVWAVLNFGFKITVWMALAAVALHFITKGTAVRAAVDEAVTRLVAGAELEAAEARGDALAAILAEQTARIERLQMANAEFEQNLQQAKTELEKTNAKLEQVESVPVRPDCRVDNRVFDLLRNK